MRTPRVLLITDPAYADDAVVRVVTLAARALPSGAFAVQLRDKGRAGRAPWGTRLRVVTGELGVPLIINGDAALARAVGADGVHFPSNAEDSVVEEARDLWRSVAAHDDAGVERASLLGVNAVLVSPIFTTPGKGPPRGTKALSRAVALARGELAVIALGGVRVTDVIACYEAGADGVAVIRALLDASQPEEAARALGMLD